MKQIAIYLAGSIKKGHETDPFYWTDADLAVIKDNLNKFEISFLNPAFRTDDLSDQFSVFGRDMLQVCSSNVVFVDARDRRGLGVGAEMMWAKMHKIPVITLAPRNTHYRRDLTTILGVSVPNFVHPFVEALSDKIVDNLIEGSEWIATMLSHPKEIKDIKYIEAAMQHYRDTQLFQDKPMRELLNSSTELLERTKRKSEVALPC